MDSFQLDCDELAAVPTDMVLGPLLFIFYMNDISTTIQRSRLTLFADDCVIYYSANTWKHIYDILQFDLNNVTA